MNNHLSSEQFAKCFIGRSSGEDLRHIAECAECRAELDRFGTTVSLFRGAIRDRVDARISSQPAAMRNTAIETVSAGVPIWRWAVLAAAAVVLVALPFFTNQKPTQDVIEKTTTATDPDTLMKAVNLHLSRTVPAPMEPMMNLIPKNEWTTETGGDR
jgi:hypothetical protein